MDALTTPSNWQKVRLGDIAEIKRGVRITKNELDVFGKYPVVSGGVGFLGYTNNFNRYENTITIAQYGTAGYVNFQKNKFWANDICFCVYPNKDVIKNIFLYYFLKVNQNYLYEISNRNATPYSISKDKILDFEILLPPLNEQIAIANILSALDHYLYSLRALILKKESVKKALSFELLSQRKRLKGFNQAWQRVRLGDICEIVKGQQINKISLNNTDKYPVINGGIDFLGYTNKFNVSKNTIAISEGGTCGYVRFMKSDFWSGGHNYSLQKISNEVNNLCLYHILKSYEKDIMKLGVGSGLKNIQLKALKDFEILLPPLNEQIAIANILSTLDHEIISLKNKKRQFENIKKALNHDLMSAKIRVLKK
ncbi:restriction endonuclease subunit S [Helicobacter pylori]|uniref:restriction endonuclease subunit S n=2 Tax=Helicobacter pylori TaxID=210 RepID=UPI0004237FFF|nr:restriction endonuclease subunit S [Helicobacter pylori]